MEGKSRTVWQEAKKSGTSALHVQEETHTSAWGEEQDKGGLCPSKGQACRRRGSEAGERAALAAGSEVMKRDWMPRLFLLTRPQLQGS